MNEKQINLITVTAMIMFIIGLFIGAYLRDHVVREFQREGIQRGVAEYNSTNGNWQWKINVNK